MFHFTDKFSLSGWSYSPGTSLVTSEFRFYDFSAFESFCLICFVISDTYYYSIV